MHRPFLRLLTLTLLLSFAAPAGAQYTRDAAATRKIDEAINTHYLATDFDKAESVLTGTIKACEDKCSPAVLGRAWMYVGIIRGSGRNDQTGAREAFQTAHSLDPSVKLDSGLATPETQASFAASSGGGGGGGAVEAPPVATGGGSDASGGNGLNCTPAPGEVETRRPIPVECTTDDEVTSVELRYKAFGEEKWKTARMERKGGSFRATVPCDATQTSGVLRLYAQGKDAKGETVSNWGNKNEPTEIQLVEQTSADPPSFDGVEPPARCAAKEICPPDFPGCDSGGKSGGTLDWGASCDNSSECKSGLLCIDGTCETAPSCSTDADCSSGTCEDGKCAAGSSGGALTGKPKRILLGLHVAQDFAMIGSDQPCGPDSQVPNYACYMPNDATTPYDTAHFKTESSGRINGGPAVATTRLLLSFDYAILANISAGVRVGWAFNGGPPSGRAVEWEAPDDPNNLQIKSVRSEGSAFLPFHLEARGAYWFGKNALGKAGLRPYLQLGGGLAQVDAKVVVKVREPSGTYDVDAWKKLGRGFIHIGGGAAYAFTRSVALQLNINAMYMLGSSGLVLQPSLGMTLGL